MNEFRNLIFEGGGVKGIAYGGALAQLGTLGIINKIVRVAGTSAGAITATFLALGYSIKDISDITAKTDFNQFTDESPGFIRDTFRIIRKYGLHKGNKFYEWIGNYIEEKAGKADLTFQELHNNKDFRDLFIIGTDLSQRVSVIYSHQTSPDMQIREAVRISMSIPFFFQAVQKKDHILVDGGIIYNYPINIFDNIKYCHNKDNAEKVNYYKKPGYIFNHETLGFRLDSKDEIDYIKKGWSNVPAKINNLKDFTFSLLNFMMESANKRHLHNNDWCRTIFIDTLGIKTTDFSLQKKDINALIKSGKDGVKKHFKWRKDNMNRP